MSATTPGTTLKVGPAPPYVAPEQLLAFFGACRARHCSYSILPAQHRVDKTRARCLALISPRNGAWHRSHRAPVQASLGTGLLGCQGIPASHHRRGRADEELKGCDHADGAPAASLVAWRGAPGAGYPRLPPLTLFGARICGWTPVRNNIKDGTPGVRHTPACPETVWACQRMWLGIGWRKHP